MPGRLSNGGNRSEFWSVTIGTSQTTLTSNTPVFITTEKITSDGARDDGGIVTWTFDQMRADSGFFSFANTYAPADGVQPLEDITQEDGVLISGAAAAGTPLAMAVRGALIMDGTDAGKRISWLGLVKLSKSTGSVNFAGNAYVKPTLVAAATKIDADLVFPSAVLGSYMVTAASVTVPASNAAFGTWVIA
jgi:hypothetical protein